MKISHKSNKIIALILAAGFSSRMGKFKALLPLGETTAIAQAVQRFRQAGIEDVRVVVGHRAEELIPVLTSLNVKPIVNPNYDCEMYISVATGLQDFADEAEGFFLLPCDVPLVCWQSIEAVLHKYRESGAAVVYPTFQGQRGHPPLITARCFSTILSWCGAGGLRGALEEFAKESVEVEVPDQAIGMDMDTPEDYEKMCDYFLHQDTPTVAECEVIFAKAKTPERVIAHGRAVAMLAQQLAQALQQTGILLQQRLVLTGALLHDLGKGNPDHAEYGARLLGELGYPLVADVVAVHMNLHVTPEEAINERALVYLADKLVKRDQFVGLTRRFAEAKKKYQDDAAVLVGVEKRLRIAQLIQEKVIGRLGQEVFDECVRVINK